MTAHHSKGIGSAFIVMDTDTEKIVPDTLILFPLEDRDAVEMVRQAGLTEWADKLDAYWKGIDLTEKRESQ